jgi:hypothetical protein
VTRRPHAIEVGHFVVFKYDSHIMLTVKVFDETMYRRRTTTTRMSRRGQDEDDVAFYYVLLLSSLLFQFASRSKIFSKYVCNIYAISQHRTKWVSRWAH